MKWTRRLALELIAIVATTAVVCVLAVLQFQSTNQISRTDEARMKAALAASVTSFEQQFTYDFERLCESFELDPEVQAPMVEETAAAQYADWAKTTAHPALLSGLYIWKTNGAVWYLESYDSKTHRFQKSEWPARFAALQRTLQSKASALYSVTYSREAASYSWTFLEDNTPALFRPIFRISPNKAGNDMGVQFLGFLVIELNSDYLQHQYLPDLVDKSFGAGGQRTFYVEVDAPGERIYQSDPAFPVSTAQPDYKVNLFEYVAEEARRRNHPSVVPNDAQWQLIVCHPAGSLQVATAALRRRSLAISFGLLAVLAGSTVLIFSLARRAERLAKLQMEFVAGVSHELCTPLAVINSAAENLVDGVVDEPRQMREYGGMIRDQGRRLEQLVDQVLLYAAGRSGPPSLDLRPTELGSVVTESVAVSEPMLRDGGFTLEKEIQQNLPLVMADPVAVAKCVENLISNAMKYAGPNRWVAVRALAPVAVLQNEVRIIVEDKGIGISPSDLANIFEPFYRVQAVRDGQIRGVGLGLYLVKQMMQSMGGRVTVSSELGGGTVFTLHFPALSVQQHPVPATSQSEPASSKA